MGSVLISTNSPLMLEISYFFSVLSFFCLSVIVATPTFSALFAGLRQITCFPSELVTVAFLVVWSCPKKITSNPATCSAIIFEASSIYSGVFMPPSHPEWNKPTTTSGCSFVFTSSIVFLAQLTISSKWSPSHKFSSSQLGIAGVIKPITVTLTPLGFSIV